MTSAHDPIALVLLARLIAAATDVGDLIRRLDPDNPCAAHVVLPEPHLARAPWIEIRSVRGLSTTLDETIEASWPDFEFEHIYVDEDDL